MAYYPLTSHRLASILQSQQGKQTRTAIRFNNNNHHHINIAPYSSNFGGVVAGQIYVQ